MLRRVPLARADVSEERIASMIRVTRIWELGTKLAVTSNRSTLRYDPPKRRFLQESRGVASQKTTFLILRFRLRSFRDHNVVLQMGGIYDVRRSGGLRCLDALTNFHTDWQRRPSNIKVSLQESELQFWYYWRDGFMKCAAEKGSGVMICGTHQVIRRPLQAYN
jgi:hypothetical protein